MTMDQAELHRLLAKAYEIRKKSRYVDAEAVAPLDYAIQLEETSLCETSLSRFMERAWPIIVPGKPFIAGRHIEAMCEHLEAVTAGQITRLLINVPYRSTKSNLVSVVWPAWEWANDPSLQYLCLSAVSDNATRDTRSMRILCKSDWYQRQWSVTFAKDQNLKTNFQNDAGGARIAAGMATGVMGANADRIIIDDPMDMNDVFSEAQKQAIYRNYDEEISRRLNDPEKSAIVACGQRLDHDDFFAHVLEDKGKWEHLVIPMRYESDHPLQRRTSIGWTDWRTTEGELMCPERFSEDYVQKEETKPGASGQLQQRPSPRGGGMFKRQWITIVDEAPKQYELAVRYFDCAASVRQQADNTAGARLILDHDGIVWLTHMVCGKWSPNDRDQVILSTVRMDGHETFVFMELEAGASGVSLIAHYTRLLRGYIFRPDRVAQRGSKERRALPLASYMEAGNVRIVRGPWTEVFLDELLSFPQGKHDDQVDAFSGAFNNIMELYDNQEIFDAPLIASGDTPANQTGQFTDEEAAELPDDLRSIIEYSNRRFADHQNLG